MPPLDYHVLVPHTWTDGDIGAAGVADASEIRANYEYKCEVKQASVAGVWSMPAYSDGWTFDPTAPHGGWIVEGASRFGDEIFHSAADGLLVTWGDFHEVEYGNESVTYAVGIGNCSTPDDVKLYDVGNATQVSFVGAAHSSNYCEIIPDVPAAALAADLGNPCVDIDGSYCYPEGDDGCPLPHAASLCAVVVASNEHGLTSPRRRSSGVLLCDGSSLVVGTVHDLAAAGQHGDIDHTTSLAVAASWQGFSDGCAPIEDFHVTLQEFIGGEWADAGVPVQTVGAPTARATSTRRGRSTSLCRLPAATARKCARLMWSAAPGAPCPMALLPTRRLRRRTASCAFGAPRPRCAGTRPIRPRRRCS